LHRSSRLSLLKLNCILVPPTFQPRSTRIEPRPNTSSKGSCETYLSSLSGKRAFEQDVRPCDTGYTICPATVAGAGEPLTLHWTVNQLWQLERDFVVHSCSISFRPADDRPWVTSQLLLVLTEHIRVRLSIECVDVLAKANYAAVEETSVEYSSGTRHETGVYKL